MSIRFSIAWRSMVGLASTSAWAAAWTRGRGLATVLAAACTVAARSGAASAGPDRRPSTSPASLLEVGDLGQEQVQQCGGVAALVAERGDRLAGDPHRRHPAPQLVSEHGGSIRPRS